MFASIENEFHAIIDATTGVAEKLEALVGLHAKAQEVEQLGTNISQVIDDVNKGTQQKVQEILNMVGKL